MGSSGDRGDLTGPAEASPNANMCPQRGMIQNPGLGIPALPSHASESPPALQSLPLPAVVPRKTLARLGHPLQLLLHPQPRVEPGAVAAESHGMGPGLSHSHSPHPSLNLSHSTHCHSPRCDDSHQVRVEGRGEENSRLKGLQRGHDIHAPASRSAGPRH